jgi:PPOX class probable F420-dependent enzyme
MIAPNPAAEGETRKRATGLRGKYLRLTTFRGNGSAVATPVWFVAQNGRLLVETDSTSYKVKRIRCNPAVRMGPCNARGKPRGEEFAAHAELLPDVELAEARRLFARKYRVDILIIGPIRWLQTHLHLGRKRGPSVLVALTPD